MKTKTKNPVMKWIKRVLLWAVGLPVALVLALYVTLECLPEEYSDRIMDWGASFFIPIQDYEAADKDFFQIIEQVNLKNYDAAFALCDSLEGHSKLPATTLNYVRAITYRNMNQPKLEEFYLRKVLESFTGDDYELLDYATAGNNLSILLNTKNDYEGALKVLMPVIATTKEHEANILMPYDKVSSLLVSMGKNLVALGRFDEGEHQFQEAIEAYKRNASRYAKYDITTSVDFTKDSIYYDVRQEVAAAASQAYLNKGLYERAASWLEVSKESLRYLQEHCDSDRQNIGDRLFRQQLSEARLLAHQGKPEEAEKVFRQCYDVSRDMSEIVKRECAQYLLDTHQWQEAIDLYHRRDSSDIGSTQTTLDGITQTLVPQYNAWRGMGNNQKAIVMADSITNVLDSAIVRWRNSDAMELATIYDTQGKEAQIAQKQAALTRLWWIATMIVLGLVILSFIIYTIYRRRITKMQAAQERIESELRIARDIQMSMVPGLFPVREGLDMYASMIPAKEVGGDLYGYLLQGDKLYIAVGDVSGKGVPASLFMAQATRLFQTMAKQGMMPAEICTRINDALSGDDNENGMFVTFWLGLVDLTTGHLNFCNAGHNPPVIGGGEHHGDFLDMIPNAPIGLFPDFEYEGEEIDTIKGRPLFIYTDGLNEAENPQQEQFGDDRLLDILRDTHFDTARHVISTLTAEVETHRAGAEPNDDLTMMCLRVN
jgi:serine phosphatase RsbU (regulator of sigma subunit)